VTLGTVFERPIQLRDIAQGLRLRSVTATQSGLVARLSGESVTFRSDSASRDNSVRGDSSYGNV
jgi:hypothetical protein